MPCYWCFSWTHNRQSHHSSWFGLDQIFAGCCRDLGRGGGRAAPKNMNFARIRPGQCGHSAQGRWRLCKASLLPASDIDEVKPSKTKQKKMSEGRRSIGRRNTVQHGAAGRLPQTWHCRRKVDELVRSNYVCNNGSIWFRKLWFDMICRKRF